MYLYRSEYVSDYEWRKDTTKGVREGNIYNQIRKEFGVDRCEDSPHMIVEICVGYWRKANAIHAWFVDNCADGVDDCQRIPVSLAKLQELRHLCKSVVLEPAVAGNVLPPREGFFFGSNNVDQWYIEDMKHTVAMLDKILSSVPEDHHTSFVYQASW